MNIITRTISTFVLLIMTQVSFAGGSNGTLLSSVMKPVKTLSGQFLQTQYDEDGQLISQSKGEFWVKAPNKIYWQTTEPFAQSLISDGNTLWIYDPDLEQVTVSEVDEQMTYAPSLILSGDSEAIEESYTVKYAKQDTFRLTPKNKGLFSHATVSFDTGIPKTMEISDELGQLTVITLSALDSDIEIDDHRFSFTPGPDIDVLGAGF